MEEPNQPRGTPEEIAQAQQEYIEALIKSMEADQKYMDALDKEEHTPENRRSYKHVFDCYHRTRIQYLEETGQIPKRKQKPRKMRW